MSEFGLRVGALDHVGVRREVAQRPIVGGALDARGLGGRPEGRDPLLRRLACRNGRRQRKRDGDRGDDGKEAGGKHRSVALAGRLPNRRNPITPMRRKWRSHDLVTNGVPLTNKPVVCFE